MGGKCPVIVDETANISTATNRILFGKFFNCGQTCIGVDHVFVHESIREPFRKALLEKLELFYGGEQSLENDGNYGKIINRFHVDRVEKYLKDDHGGSIIYGGKAVNKETRFMGPTVIETPRKDSLLMQDEIFGPILPIFYYSDLKELIKEINSRPKPLVVYQFSESKANTSLVRSQTSSGAYVVNDTILQMTNLSLPFGGVGASGYGRYHGKDGFLAFTNPKSIALISSMDSYPINQRYPPYNDSKKSTMTTLLKFGFITYGQLGRGLLAILLVIAAVVLYNVWCPCTQEKIDL
uniref:Aldehyde dehydrogenase domain-containing protein n=1 Tax=Nymphaea colorata TaxID=210225 RepID=A0A5K1HIR8_9MAGN|nr:unnamed protein product [Nymphaea colorata]